MFWAFGGGALDVGMSAAAAMMVCCTYTLAVAWGAGQSSPHEVLHCLTVLLWASGGVRGIAVVCNPSHTSPVGPGRGPPSRLLSGTQCILLLCEAREASLRRTGRMAVRRHGDTATGHQTHHPLFATPGSDILQLWPAATLGAGNISWMWTELGQAKRNRHSDYHGVGAERADWMGFKVYSLVAFSAGAYTRPLFGST